MEPQSSTTALRSFLLLGAASGMNVAEIIDASVSGDERARLNVAPPIEMLKPMLSHCNLE